MQGGLNKFKSIIPIKGDTVYSNFKSDMNLDYLSVPILARQSWKINKKISIYAGVGPIIDFLIKANRTISSDSIFTNHMKTKPSNFTIQSIVGSGSQAINSMNIGVNGILGLSYKINRKEAIFIEIGAIYALSPIQYNSENGSNYPFSAMITVGYAFTYKEHYKNRYQRQFRNY